MEVVLHIGAGTLSTVGGKAKKRRHDRDIFTKDAVIALSSLKR